MWMLVDQLDEASPPHSAHLDLLFSSVALITARLALLLRSPYGKASSEIMAGSLIYIYLYLLFIFLDVHGGKENVADSRHSSTRNIPPYAYNANKHMVKCPHPL